MPMSRSYCDFAAVRSLCLELPPDDEGHEADDGDEEPDDGCHHLGHGLGVAFLAVFLAGAFFGRGLLGRHERAAIEDGQRERCPVVLGGLGETDVDVVMRARGLGR
jgi:hypothetical protein